MVRSTEKSECTVRLGRAQSSSWGRGRRFGTPPQRTARPGGQWRAWWSASRQALPHNGALSLVEPQSQQVGSSGQDARHHAAVRSTSTCRSQPSSWFQLANVRVTTFPSHPANNLRARIVRKLTGIEPWSKLGRTAAPLRADVAAITCRFRCSQEDIWHQHPPNGRRVPAVPPRRVGPGEMGGS
jgi:hypothetical protein